MCILRTSMFTFRYVVMKVYVSVTERGVFTVSFHYGADHYDACQYGDSTMAQIQLGAFRYGVFQYGADLVWRCFGMALFRYGAGPVRRIVLNVPCRV